MNAKKAAAVIIFAALTIVLNFSPVKIPAPYAPFLIYQIWEIPIVTAFLLYGVNVGVLISIINTLVLIAVFPGALPTGPLYNLAAILGMLLGIGMIKIFVERHSPKNEAFVAALLTISGAVVRALLMALINWALLRFPPPVGYSFPEEAIIATIPLVVVFNITLALYTIPLGYSLARALKFYIKTLK
jgi:riboflavin transporter FmnP